jgi:hypothetical protein
MQAVVVHRVFCTFLIVIALLCGVPAKAADLSWNAHYDVRVTGIRVGAAHLKGRLDTSRYVLEGSAELSGLARLITNGKGRVWATGTLDRGRVRPETYVHDIIADDEPDHVTFTFARDRVSKLHVEPAEDRPARDRVPLTEAHKAGVLDPLSSLLIPTNSKLDRSICARTLPVFDGRQRFDLALAFDRLEWFRVREASAEQPVVVCRIRYRPVVGHRAGRKVVRYMANNRHMEIWFARLSDSGFAAPVRIRLRTMVGPLVIMATRFQLNAAALQD